MSYVLCLHQLRTLFLALEMQLFLYFLDENNRSRYVVILLLASSRSKKKNRRGEHLPRHPIIAKVILVYSPRLPSLPQTCELRLVRCPYQCGVKVLVRNLERHKETCSLKEPVDAKPGVTCSKRPTTPPIGPATNPGNSKAHGYHPPSPRKARGSVESGDTTQMGAQTDPSLAPDDANRTVTCMRCHESLPFHLVPSHGPKCKSGGVLLPTAQAPAHFLGGEQTPPSSRNRSGVGRERESFSLAVQKRPPPLPSTGSFPPPVIGPGVWNAASSTGVLTHGMSIPRSPHRPKDVRSWGTRQVTSWLRETMQPPKADIISKFHRDAVDGAALLRLTDRYVALRSSEEDCERR